MYVRMYVRMYGVGHFKYVTSLGRVSSISQWSWVAEVSEASEVS